MFLDKYNKQAEVLQEFLEGRVEALSRATGFVKRQSKLTGALFVKGVVLSWLERPTGSLNEVVQSLAELGVDISESGLQQRITEKAVALLSGLFQAGLKQLPTGRRIPDGVLKHFKAVYLLDSTSVSLPEALKVPFAGLGGSASPASAKIRLSFEYLSGSLAALEVVAGREADQHCQQHVNLAQPGTLHLFDLGFFKQQVFQALAEAHAYFISRLQMQTALYAQPHDTQALDLETLLASLTTPQADIDVHLGRLTRLSVRLIIQKLPDKQVAERRRKAKRAAAKRGQTCSARHLHLLAWSMFITNVPRAWLDASQIMLVYRVRWQIELIFKLWKSQAKLAVVGQCSPQRFLVQLYARLLGLLLFHWLLVDLPLDPHAELSLPKAFALFQRCASRLRFALAAPLPSLPALLHRLAADFLRFALKHKRRKAPSTLASLLDAHA